MALMGCASAATIPASATTETPQYFQTTPELWPGPTATGTAPFLAQTNLAPFGESRTVNPNDPLETQMPIQGKPEKQNIFRLMGQLSHYQPAVEGFGVEEYPLPAGANITQVNVLHRHGSRYPTSSNIVAKLGSALGKAHINATGALSFLNSWKYSLGAEILVPVGRQEMFDSGVLHYYQYAHLYDTNTKIIARTPTQDRMTKSAEYFLAGFFGQEWTNNATIEVIIENSGFNNSLAGGKNCKNSNGDVSALGDDATAQWYNIYLANATARFNSMTSGYNWTADDTYAAQTLCPYETVALGFSKWCDLFTYEEWQGFEYSLDLNFNGDDGFASPTGRAVGIAYVEEFLARLQHHVLSTPEGTANITLDNNTATFPINQTLNFDFSHDTNIFSILTAFGFTQFQEDLPATHMVNRNTIISHITPFGARLDVEVIKTPQPVPANRSSDYVAGPPTTYLHFILNQRTLPLGASFPECGDRVDGWCDIDTFLAVQEKSAALANADYACNGDYPKVPYGTIKDGAPLT
ncbi:phosphoglycerate mutase-like protein [Xylona heveae TC161]|uniref:3-phytase n=1 Tax=Xylona heveae (strain CBS 132557 / TC161) TaxID=1328760 RepID=A0A164ZKG7_XYLHT|nr:phosphoglycerate mutase-like protein [Xylona heveae TC161]KZF19204.1 phosphoglycerate mutase-like protein [Xylona heveae TC161]